MLCPSVLSVCCVLVLLSVCVLCPSSAKCILCPSSAKCVLCPSSVKCVLCPSCCCGGSNAGDINRWRFSATTVGRLSPTENR